MRTAYQADEVHTTQRGLSPDYFVGIRDDFSLAGMYLRPVVARPLAFFLGVHAMATTQYPALTLLTALRDQLTADGYSPFLVNWGPWWQADYYAV